MNVKSLVRVINLVAILSFCLLSGDRLLAANPDFSRTLLLPPRDGQTLSETYFRDNPVLTEHLHFPSSSATYWTPTNADVAQVQQALWKYEASGVDVVDSKWDKFQLGPHTIALTTDVRQYAGATINGKEYILIVGSTTPGSSTMFNASDFGDDQQFHVPFFTDGGSAFQAVYDPVSCLVKYLIFDHFVEKRTPMFTL